jgi:hypothetical protein
MFGFTYVTILHEQEFLLKPVRQTLNHVLSCDFVAESDSSTLLVCLKLGSGIGELWEVLSRNWFGKTESISYLIVLLILRFGLVALSGARKKVFKI